MLINQENAPNRDNAYQYEAGDCGEVCSHGVSYAACLVGC